MAPVPAPSLRQRLQARLVAQWYQPRVGVLAALLWPLALLHGLLLQMRDGLWVLRVWRPASAPVPVLVVGNLVAGGAGKTPTVIALVQALRAAGRRPGVISRGYGRQDETLRSVQPHSLAVDVGDEPLLIARRTGVPVWVARQRIDAARALCAAQPQVDLIICDDGLQHRALARQAELLVFDERGVGNGLLLPAGPLREPLPAKPAAGCFVLYSAGHASTPLPGALARRRLSGAVALADWQAGAQPARAALDALRGRLLWAAAGIAAPERFFSMLEAEGLTIHRLPLPDHHPFTPLPWPADIGEVLLTEKDAVKIDAGRCSPTQVWVVGLDFELPVDLLPALLRQLDSAPRPCP